VSDRYRVVSLEELGTDAVGGRARWHAIRASLGVASFGIDARTATEATTTTGRRFVIDFDQAHRRERWVIVDGEG
jgi:hypothetical protein